MSTLWHALHHGWQRRTSDPSPWARQLILDRRCISSPARWVFMLLCIRAACVCVCVCAHGPRLCVAICGCWKMDARTRTLTTLWYRNSCYMTAAGKPPCVTSPPLCCVPLPVTLCVWTGVFVSPQWATVLLRVSKLWEGLWRGRGAVLAVGLRWRVNQAAPQTASCAPAAVWGPSLVSSRAVIPNSFHLLPLLLPKSLLCHHVFSEKPILIDFI